MSSVRDRTIVVDFSVLPQRPKLEIVQKFVEKGLRLVPTNLRSIQLHNIRHCVLIEMEDPAAAAETAQRNHLKHTIRTNPSDPSTKIAIPVYVDDDTVDVRVHDLPTDMPNTKIAAAMREYGEVLTIRDEVWRNFFAGVPNGVRVLKMKLSRPIPSYITVCELTTLATHTGQSFTCRRCGGKRHPSKNCSEIAKQQKTPSPDLPTADPTIAEPQVIVPHTEVNDDDGFTIVGKKGKTKRQISHDDDDDNRTTGNDHCDDHDQREDQQQQKKTPKRRLFKPAEKQDDTSPQK